MRIIPKPGKLHNLVITITLFGIFIISKPYTKKTKMILRNCKYTHLSSLVLIALLAITVPKTTLASGSTKAIVLIDFTVSLEDSSRVRLEWITGSETNNDFFTVERSENGLTFKPVAEVRGSGTTSSSADYVTYDDVALSGGSYYRLKQTNYDGQFEYVKIVALNLERNSDGSCVLKVFPNPCIGQCTIDLSDCKHNENADIKVEMVDASGNLVFSHIPYRDFDGSFQFNIDVGNNLKPGVYIIRGSSSTESYRSKVIVK